MNLGKIADYQIWANNKLRESVLSLSDDEFVQDVGVPVGNVKQICLHMILAIDYNLETRIDNRKMDVKTIVDRLQSLSKKKLVKEWKKVDERLLEYIMRCDEELVQFPNIVKGEGEVDLSREDFYFQYLSHTIYHRGQLMTAIKKLGKEGKATDYLFYLFDLEEK